MPVLVDHPVILIAETENDFSDAKLLFLEYAEELNIDFCFQDFDKELNEIAVQYHPPSGVLLLMKGRNELMGCVGLRRIDGEVSEMKRMYIRKQFRGEGWSKKLIHDLLAHAKELKYRSVRLDTLPQMKEAVQLYLAFGFREIKPYRFNPVEGTTYMELKLE